MDLISREALISALNKNSIFQKVTNAEGKNTIEIINEQPTIDAVPVVKAEWKYYKKQGIAVCTNCSFERNVDDDFGKAVACPNCGADMRGKQYE